MYETLTAQLKQECLSRSLNFVGSRGNPSSPICFVGEGPGAEEDAQGFPFVGPSGKEADRMLWDAHVTPDLVWFTNPYKVRPPDNDLEKLPSLGIPLDLFERQFVEELNFRKPTIVVAAGATPMRLLCPQTCIKVRGKPTFPITKWRGSILQSPFLRYPHYVIPVSHPAFVLREWSERQICVMILERVLEEWNFVHRNGKLNPLPEREILTNPPTETVLDFLTEIGNKPVSCDIEVLWQRNGRRMFYSIAFASSPWLGMSLCPWDYNGIQRLMIFRAMSYVLRNNPLIGQNFISFDSHWLATVGLKPDVSHVQDTLIRHHVLYLEMPHDLGFQTMEYTREPYYKDEGKQWTPGSDKTQLLRYNTKDALVTFEIFLEQEHEFEQLQTS